MAGGETGLPVAVQGNESTCMPRLDPRFRREGILIFGQSRILIAG
jgi:hypothetical protein